MTINSGLVGCGAAQPQSVHQQVQRNGGCYLVMVGFLVGFVETALVQRQLYMQNKTMNAMPSFDTCPKLWPNDNWPPFHSVEEKGLHSEEKPT